MTRALRTLLAAFIASKRESSCREPLITEPKEGLADQSCVAPVKNPPSKSKNQTQKQGWHKLFFGSVMSGSQQELSRLEAMNAASKVRNALVMASLGLGVV